jgi:hypothetical protein
MNNGDFDDDEIVDALYYTPTCINGAHTNGSFGTFLRKFGIVVVFSLKVRIAV